MISGCRLHGCLHPVNTPLTGCLQGCKRQCKRHHARIDGERFLESGRYHLSRAAHRSVEDDLAMISRWKKRAIEVVSLVRDAHPEAQGEALRVLLRDAYPFGLRKYHLYQVWLDCVNEACGRPRRERPVDELPLFAAQKKC